MALTFEVLASLLWSKEFLIRCTISGAIAGLLYLTFAAITHYFFPRDVSKTRDVYAMTPTSDLALGLFSVVFGSPFLQLFGVIHEYTPICFMYNSISEYGWAYWVFSIPMYLILWDATFYCTHLILHTDFVYRISHRFHHAFRPPTAWSGIAIDGPETFLSGLFPYLVPLFVMPFHVYTVYAVNIVLVGWATWLHSRCHWPGNWLMIGPMDHNVHHSRGQKNANYGAIFKIWDRLGGTLDTEHVPYWIAEERKQDVLAKAAGTGKTHSE